MSLSLGYIPAADAQAACDQMNIEEAQERGDSTVQWHQENRDDAIKYLLGDPLVRELFEPRQDFAAMKLRDYFEDVYKEWRARTRPGGWKQEERVWKRINQEIGDAKLQRIDPHLVADYLDGLVVRRGQRAGKPASGTTRRLHRAAIQALLKRAYRLKHIGELPQLAVFQIEGATKRAIQKPDPLDLGELEKLMKASDPKHRAMWAVAAGQGLRPAELNRVRWEDIDFEAKTLRVRGTKTEGADAIVPLTPLARRELEVWWIWRERPAEGLAFPSRNGGEFGDQGWKKALRAAAKKAKIKRRIYPYLLRDSFATIAWSQGIPFDIARRAMRHTASSRMLEEVYCRPRPADVAAKMEAFDFVDAESKATAPNG